MPKCSNVGRMLPLLACWLTAAASGDDFNLVRLVFPSFFSASGSTPLDDPNTDLYESWGESSRFSETAGQETIGPPAMLMAAAGAADLDFSRPLHARLPCSLAFGRLPLNPPLLC